MCSSAITGLNGRVLPGCAEAIMCKLADNPSKKFFHRNWRQAQHLGEGAHPYWSAEGMVMPAYPTSTPRKSYGFMIRKLSHFRSETEYVYYYPVYMPLQPVYAASDNRDPVHEA